MQAADPNTFQERIGGMRTGNLQTLDLIAGMEGSLSNYSLGLSRTLTGYQALRHRHCFEQVRYLIEGEVDYGNGRVLKEGGVAYFPESVHYGPQVRKPGTKMVEIQFGGANECGYVSRRQWDEAVRELRTTGTLENGVYTYIDEKGQRHNRDSFEAMWEKAIGIKPRYTAPRYNEIVILTPASFRWIDGKESPGIAHKWVGTFTERGTRLGFVRIEPGATFEAGRHHAPEILFLTKGAVQANGQSYPVHSAFGFEPGEPTISIVATETSELLRLQLPDLKVPLAS